MTVVIGTAGHIDHGKTTLLKALTGIDADRLPEERERGMTIDVGYAHLSFDDGRELDFVDVPGHDRLVGNMLVGAGEVDAVLLVVAADDGPRAQTVEHLELINALGLEHLAVAITKSDVVDEGRVAAVEEQVRRMIGRTRSLDVPVARVSAISGDGIAELKAALDRLATDVAGMGFGAGGAARLAVDRAFSIRGRGAVVTGTLRRGSIARGDRLRVEPGDWSVTVREVQVHGHGVPEAGPGRAALNLRGVELEDVRRGLVLTTDENVVASDRLLVALAPVATVNGLARSLPADRARLRLHIGTDQVEATVGGSGREAAVLPDGRATVVLRLDRPIAVGAGDRFVLRRGSAGLAEAGGIVLDPIPPMGAARRRVTAARLAAIAEVAAVEAATAEQRRAAAVELHGALAVPDGVALAEDVEERLGASAVALARSHPGDHAAGPGAPLSAVRTALSEELRRSSDLPAAHVPSAVTAVLDALVATGRLIREGDRIRDPDAKPAGLPAPLEAAMARLEAALDVPAPPPLAQAAAGAGCSADGIRILERLGRIVRVADDLAWASSAYQALTRQAVRLASAAPMTPAALRDSTGTSRKYVMALLEDLDRRAVLRRTPEGHVPGARAGELGEGPGSPASDEVEASPASRSATRV